MLCSIDSTSPSHSAPRPECLNGQAALELIHLGLCGDSFPSVFSHRDSVKPANSLDITDTSSPSANPNKSELNVFSLKPLKSPLHACRFHLKGWNCVVFNPVWVIWNNLTDHFPNCACGLFTCRGDVYKSLHFFKKLLLSAIYRSTHNELEKNRWVALHFYICRSV